MLAYHYNSRVDQVSTFSQTSDVHNANLLQMFTQSVVEIKFTFLFQRSRAAHRMDSFALSFMTQGIRTQR